MAATRRFGWFVILAGMRTGSNLLEESLAQAPGVALHGELFNPHFIGGPARRTALGLTLAARDRDPLAALARMKAAAGDALPGFRFFRDHDPRVLMHLLDDPACAKIVLTRNPLEAYVSRKIAAETGQWRLTDARHRKAAAVAFDGAEFAAHLDAEQAFRARIRRALQETGQAGFHLSYDELGDAAILTGLLRFLGIAGGIAPAARLKKQNPAPVAERVTNPAEMTKALAEYDPFGLDDPPDFEPARGARVPSFVAGTAAPVLFLPMPGGPAARPRAWLARHEAATGGEAPAEGFTARRLRRWQRAHPGHLSFTVLRHPLARAWGAFARHILPTGGPGAFVKIRARLVRDYGLGLPDAPDAAAPDELRAAFMGFLGFLEANLAGQTGLRIDPAWASQSALLSGMARAVVPSMVIREPALAPGLAHLEGAAGLAAQQVDPPAPGAMAALAAIHDAEMEKAARRAYRRDYAALGFGDWRAAP